MEFSIDIYNKLVSFIEQSKKNNNYELEIRFGKEYKFKKDNKISSELYQKVLNKLTFSTDNNGFGFLFELNNTLDIGIDSSENNNSQRLSILGVDDIKKYWLNNELDGLSYNFIEKERIDKIDDNNYNIRISLNNELPKENILEKNINLLKSNTFEKTYRLKNRYNIITDDKLFSIDLTSVKMGKGTSFRSSNTLKSNPTYEIEIEFIDKKSNISNEEITNKLLEHSNIIFKLLTGSNIILTNTVKNMVIDEYKKLISTKYQNQNKNKNNFFSFIAASPVTIHRENLLKNDDFKNIYQKYAVTLKADGERNFLFVLKSDDKELNGKIFIFNNNEEVKDTGFIDPNWTNTLIEGELINTNDNKKEFYMYDILFSNGEDVRRKHLVNIRSSEKEGKGGSVDSRLSIIEQFLKSGSRKKVDLVLDENTISIKNKKYQFSILPDGSDIFQKIKDIWDNRKYNTFEVDGIIFTPIFEYYPLKLGSWSSLFKWKPPHLNTIDFLIKSIKDNNMKDIKSPYIEVIKRPDGKEETTIRQYKTFELYVSGQKIIYNKSTKPYSQSIPVLFNPFSMDDKNSMIYNRAQLFVNEVDKIFATDPITEESEEIYDDIIVEFAYDEEKEEGFKWVPCRFRRDKTSLYKGGKPIFGNGENVATDIFRAIKNPVTEEMIKTGKIPISENKEQIDQKAYFSQLNNGAIVDNAKRVRFSYQNFHNHYIKYQLYYFSSPSYIKDIQRVEGKVLDLCCGKGVDINKIKKAHYEEIVGLDIDINNVKYAQNYYKTVIPMPKPRAFYARGDAGKLIWPDQSSGFTESDKIYTRKFIPTKYYFDTISLMFCIHYLFEDEVKLRTLLQNLNDNLKIGGFVIGTTFDGERIYSNLEGKQSISGKTKEGEIMWKIDKKYGAPKIQFTDKKANYGKEIDVFVKTIGRNHSEFLVNFKYFDKIMEEYGFSLVSRKPFEEYYNELIEEKNIANHDPKELKKNIEMAKNMSEDEKRFSFLSSGFIYKKERNSSDSLFKKLVELMEKKEVKESASSGKKIKGAISKNTENLIEYLEDS